jgi:hypothetical protein
MDDLQKIFLTSSHQMFSSILITRTCLLTMDWVITWEWIEHSNISLWKSDVILFQLTILARITFITSQLISLESYARNFVYMCGSGINIVLSS